MNDGPPTGMRCGSARFEDWYASRYRRLVASLTVVCGSRTTAIDVADEALSRAYLAWDRVGRMDAPEAWVFRVAVNVWKRQERRAAIGRRLARRGMASAAADAMAADLPIELREMLAALPGRPREVLVLRHVLGLSQRETARALGIAEGTVASALSEARRAMRAAIDQSTREVR